MERDELDKQEIMRFPLPAPLKDGSMEVSFAQLRDATESKQARRRLIQSISKAYDLSAHDEVMISDAVTYTLDYFRLGASSKAAQPAAESDLGKYASMFAHIIENSFGRDKERGLSACFYTGNSPLVVLEVSLCKGDAQGELQFRQADDELSKVLALMDKVLLEEPSTGVYVRRDVHIYCDDKILIAKRDQKRLWSQSAAMRDADEVYAEIMKAWGEGAWR